MNNRYIIHEQAKRSGKVTAFNKLKNMQNRQDFERFVALYWGQELAILLISYPVTYKINKSSFEDIEHLQLRSIESLTDEEITELIKISESYLPDEIAECYIEDGRVKIRLWKNGHQVESLYFEPCMIDYLRSIGILVPFMQYSVEDIIRMGWVVIKK